MSLKSRIRSEALGLFLGAPALSLRRAAAEARRRLGRRPHHVRVFLQLDDPYSYLVSLFLPELQAAYDVTIEVLLCQALGGEYAPHAELRNEYALADCRLMAREFGVPFLDKGDTPVIERRRALLDLLAGEQDNPGFAELCHAALSAYWRGDTGGVGRLLGNFPGDGSASELIERNQRRLRELGHYDSAMLHYGGEWYWGVDRLHYLAERLDKLGVRHQAAKTEGLAALRQAMRLGLPAAVPANAGQLPELEFFFSFRSPYSYLALERTFRIADAFGIRLRVRGVLPMVMRGLSVPREKLLYIITDAKREAAWRGIPFRKFCDPLGAGTERCLAVLGLAQELGREREFLLAAGQAIWDDARDVATDAGLRRIVEQAGIAWSDALAALGGDAWRQEAEHNREALLDSGLWGVPSFRFGDVVFWGQDRDWLLARQVEDRCQDGEGILV
ncbi:MAG: DsbA family protein [Gammaproteobacteria bacterium]|nr:DsbA family protein [Gammaproteobacteria bacterium]MDH4253108.1 DsbA family protein [Gammaproteobacteria bacterium]MDH5308934.1 DsbA family protein [Gammaproteobacteria bacterium]